MSERPAAPESDAIAASVRPQHVFHCLADVERVVGVDLGTSDWIDITQDRIDAFAAATGDHQWIHVDLGRAAAGPFGTTIAHGYLTLSLLPMLARQVYSYATARVGVNYGSNRVRFPVPVPVGSAIRLHARIVAVDRLDRTTAKVTVRNEIEIRDNARPALIAETVAYVMY